MLGDDSLLQVGFRNIEKLTLNQHLFESRSPDYYVDRIYYGHKFYSYFLIEFEDMEGEMRTKIEGAIKINLLFTTITIRFEVLNELITTNKLKVRRSVICLVFSLCRFPFSSVLFLSSTLC